MKEGLSTQQKEADKDLNILALFTLLPLMGFLAFQEPIINFSRSPDHSLWIRLMVLALCQFSVAGLGIVLSLFVEKKAYRNMDWLRKNSFQLSFKQFLLPYLFSFSSSLQVRFIPIFLFNPSS